MRLSARWAICPAANCRSHRDLELEGSLDPLCHTDLCHFYGQILHCGCQCVGFNLQCILRWPQWMFPSPLLDTGQHGPTWSKGSLCNESSRVITHTSVVMKAKTPLDVCTEQPIDLWFAPSWASNCPKWRLHSVSPAWNRALISIEVY